MRKLKVAIVLMAVLALLAAACGGEAEDDGAAAAAAADAAAAAEAQAAAEAEAAAAAAAAAEAQAAADEAAADAAAAQAELEAAQAELEATRAAADAGDEEAQAALAAAEEAAAAAEAAAAEAAMEAEEAQKALAESRMVEAPGIRDVEVAMGIGTCCADFAYWQIPIELDWWEELGITIVPNTPTYWYLTNSTETNAKLQRQELHMANGWVPSLFAALETFAQEIPVIHFADIFIGYAVLVSPESDSKTALEFMAEGMSYPEAAKAAVQQLVGEDIYITPGSTVQAQYANAFFAYLDAWWEDVQEDIPILDDEGNPLVLMNRDGTPRLDDDGNVQPIRITTNDWRNYANPQYVEDPVIVELSAVPGRIQYAMPFQAPTLVQMIRNGWDPLINFAQIFEHDPVSQQGAIASATTGGTGLIANREWVEANKDVTYRVLSVAHRIFDFLDDPETQYIGWEIEANLINEKRQLTMEPEDIGVIWDQIDPSFSWADQEALWDLSLPSYHPETVFRNQVEERKAKGELSADYDTQAGLEKFLLAQELYYDMKGMQERADELFAKAEGMDLSESQAALVDQARHWYDIFNFYDAERWLEAALIG